MPDNTQDVDTQTRCETCVCTSVCKRERTTNCQSWKPMPSREVATAALMQIAKGCECTCLDDRDPYCELFGWDDACPETADEALSRCNAAQALVACGFELAPPSWEDEDD